MSFCLKLSEKECNVNVFKEKETFYFEKRRQLPGEFFSLFISFLKLGKI